MSTRIFFIALIAVCLLTNASVYLAGYGKGVRDGRQELLSGDLYCHQDVINNWACVKVKELSSPDDFSEDTMERNSYEN